MNAHTLTAEVDKNYDFFQRNMARYLPAQYGRFALIRHCEIVDFFDDPGEAAARGSKFRDGLYSIQLVDPEPINLGLYSNG